MLPPGQGSRVPVPSRTFSLRFSMLGASVKVGESGPKVDENRKWIQRWLKPPDLSWVGCGKRQKTTNQEKPQNPLNAEATPISHSNYEPPCIPNKDGNIDESSPALPLSS